MGIYKIVKIKIIDNFANITEQLKIIQHMQGDHTHGFDYTSVSKQNKKTKFTIDYPQFVKSIFHTQPSCYIDNRFFPLVYYLLHTNGLSNNFIDRIKINTTFPYPNNTKEKHGPIHQDFDVKGLSIIYYVNNSDGDTIFFDKNLKEIERVSPKQGRAVVFDSNINHAGCCPINSPYRQIINFVLYK